MWVEKFRMRQRGFRDNGETGDPHYFPLLSCVTLDTFFFSDLISHSEQLKNSGCVKGASGITEKQGIRIAFHFPLKLKLPTL